MTELKREIFNLKEVKTISVYIGNAVRWCGSMKKRPISTAQEGLPKHLVCNLIQPTERIDPNEREDIRISAKLFICKADTMFVKEAVTRACLELGISQLDSVILAVAALSEGHRPTLEDLKPYWKELEDLVQEQKIASIGVSDLDQEVLEALCQHTQVRPSSLQVNLASCCVIPPDLAAFANENNIQLLTHNDPAGLIHPDMLPVGSFQDALCASLQDPHDNEWVPHWILRYSAVIKHRGIIKSKGYMVHAKKQVTQQQ
ncbi:glutamate--cysteine ligase regulatory subunit-like isoform X3 [Rhincodon typus]|uniref:glutamate--cysteine ligase regulatory subunit-like isoform X3 n=1 Tax=Rhincodon typus TaxID=259920 RepID=UPI00202E57D7|nr:glutamate--cysteine ligase regulatory subunit-like isoform X3 [Rhincodon typus]